ncbi:MAG: peptidyl-prolyl cis-trans isomerase [Phycisphaerae bacterium]|nr:peptidyl-prolyl cis-trans isomerase [Phycisphaerae bacterium]
MPMNFHAPLFIDRQSHWVVRSAGVAISVAASSCLLLAISCASNDSISNRSSNSPPTVSERLAAAGASNNQADGVEAQPTQPAPAARPLATVNGEPIAWSEFMRILIDSHGLPLFQLMLVREVAAQEARRLGITITKEDIDREYDITAHAEHMNGKDVESLTPARRERIIDEWTRSRGVSRSELAVAMERQAILRKVAEERLAEKEVTDEQIERAYQREFGEKVEVRHIQFSNQRVAAQIRARLDQGESFERLVADYSQNVLTKINQGLMPPFSAVADLDDVPAVLVKAAFELQPGDVSNPIEVDGYLHILKLERRIPAVETPLEEVRPTLVRRIRQRMIEAKMEEIGRRLLLAAQLKVLEPNLRDRYDDDQRAGRIEGPPLIGQ